MSATGDAATGLIREALRRLADQVHASGRRLLGLDLNAV